VLSFLVEDTLSRYCQAAAFANLAVDGWSDRCGGRYQGITARLIDSNEEAMILLLPLKEIKALHDNAGELQPLVDATEKQVGLSPKIVNTCSGRCAMNVSAFRCEVTIDALMGGQFWLPRACYVFNNSLMHFFDHSPRLSNRFSASSNASGNTDRSSHS
jgi:hypothetical protein